MYSHLLVPTNFRPAARLARQRALQLAAEQRARVTLLHVSSVPVAWKQRTDLAAVELLHDVCLLPQHASTCIPTQVPREELLRRRALDRLSQEVHPDWRQSVELRLAWRCGNVLAQILEHACEEQVDAIVLGWRRSRWLRIFPNLAQSILRKAPCEVILVSRPPTESARRQTRPVPVG